MDFFPQLAQKIAAVITSAFTALSIVSKPLPPTPVSSPSPEIINVDLQSYYIASDTVEVSKGQNISYHLQIPKNGGGITGSYSGLCSGPITGTYQPNSNPSLSGHVKGTCKLGLFNIDLSANYTGVITDGKYAKINYTVQSPTQTSGSKTIPLHATE